MKLTESMIAKRKFPYGKNKLSKGDSFEAESGHVSLLVGLGFAERRDNSNEEKQPAPAAKKATAKRTYQRRDMRARD